MQKELIEFRQTYAEVAAGQKRLEKQRIQAEGLTQEWLKRAKLALENGDEAAARAALERKNQQQELAASLTSQIKIQGEAVSNLFSKMQQVWPEPKRDLNVARPLNSIASSRPRSRRPRPRRTN